MNEVISKNIRLYHITVNAHNPSPAMHDAQYMYISLLG